MINNMSFYKFLHKQILIVIALTFATAGGYVYIGYLYGSLLPETIWFIGVVLMSYWGYTLHTSFSSSKMTIEDKERWLEKAKYFFFFYSHIWTIMFFIYTSRNDIELHYIAIATQIGTSVVSVATLSSQRKLSIITLITLMMPLTLYLLFVNEFYSYLLAFFSVVLGWVLLYSAGNTFNYLVKSKYQAYHDYLTSIGNRHFFIEYLDDAVKVQTTNKKPLYLLLIDLDHFKTINDSLGHDVGDLLLKEVSNRMRKLSEKHSNTIARLGGDEFCILSTPHPTEEICLEHATIFANTLLKTIKEIYHINEHHLYISASIGVSVINSMDSDANTFIKEADIAMYEAKNKGRNGVIIFNKDLSKRVERKLEIEKLLNFSLTNNEISLMYQPQVNSEGKIIGCEVLTRWYNNDLGHVGPDEFIPIAEDTGFILELGSFILKEAICTLQRLDKDGIKLDQMSINISMRQLFHKGFLYEVRNICDTTLTKELASKLVFEITETTVADDVKELIKNMYKIKECGIRFSMDDFGTGYSSLSYLRQIPIDELKIDKSFVFGIGIHEDNGAIIKTILDISKNLNLSIVAEGIETAEQKSFLLENGCNILQGYYFARPMIKDDLKKMILNSKK